MIAEVEAGNVSAVIVKDMSRFGRDYLKVGFYTEVMFKEKGVRFIAINNGIDSANQQDSDFTPFLNIMNSLQRLLLLASSASCQLCLILMIAFLFYKKCRKFARFLCFIQTVYFLI